MKNRLVIWFMMLSLVVITPGLTSCRKEGRFEKLGRETDRALKKAADEAATATKKAEKAAKKAEKAAKKAGKKAGDAVSEATDKIKEGLE